MLRNISEKLPLSLFEKISSNEYWRWNSEKTEFKTLNIVDNITFKWIEYLKVLWLVKSVEIIENKHLLIKQDLKKLNLLRSLVHDKNIKYNFSLAFIKNLVSIIQNQTSGSLIDAETIIDYIGIEDQTYIFYSIELLIHSLATYKNEYIARMLTFLIKELDEDYRNKLLSSIEMDYMFFYFENSKIKEINKIRNSRSESDNNFWIAHLEEIWDDTILPILTGNQEWNIFYYKYHSGDNETWITDDIPSYDTTTESDIESAYDNQCGKIRVISLSDKEVVFSEGIVVKKLTPWEFAIFEKFQKCKSVSWWVALSENSITETSLKKMITRFNEKSNLVKISKRKSIWFLKKET